MRDLMIQVFFYFQIQRIPKGRLKLFITQFQTA